MSLPLLLLERYRLGELDDDEKGMVESLLDDRDRAVLAGLAVDDAAILHRYPPVVMGRQIRQRLPSPRRTITLAALILAGAMLTFQLRPGIEPEPTVSDVPKGPTRLVIYRVGADIALLRDGSEAEAGDRLQIEVAPGSAAYGVVLSIDGRGLVTTHLPQGGGAAVPFEPGRTLTLPHGFVLDDAPEYERFLLVVSDRPFEVEPVLDAARRLASSAAASEDRLFPQGAGPFRVSSVLLRKVDR